jgi:hypothetical protein
MVHAEIFLSLNAWEIDIDDAGLINPRRKLLCRRIGPIIS